jgi:hypothetical protein
LSWRLQRIGCLLDNSIKHKACQTIKIPKNFVTGCAERFFEGRGEPMFQAGPGQAVSGIFTQRKRRKTTGCSRWMRVCVSGPHLLVLAGRAKQEISGSLNAYVLPPRTAWAG